MLIRVIAMTVFMLGVQSGAVAAERPDKAVTEEGEINGAKFRIDIPEGWNGGLVMYAHGYVMVTQPAQFDQTMPKACQTLGFAVAQSLYSRQGWAAREGILDTEALRRYFVDKYGPTYPTIIAGHSQGGAITYATIERFPEVYDGALPLCAAGPSALEFFKGSVFDRRALFDYFLPGLPGSAVEFPDGTQTFVKVMAKATELVKANPEKAQAYADLTSLSSTDVVPLSLALWSEMLRELTERAGGNAFDNTTTIYTGTADDITLNKEIKRYQADEKAVAYLRHWVTLTGEISDPVLALHSIVDDLVPPSFANEYSQLTTRAGTSKFYIQSWTQAPNHCMFSESETIDALKQLVDWIQTGKRPTPGDWTEKK